MRLIIALYAWFFLTLFSILRCWLKKGDEKTSIKYRVVTSIITFITCSAGTYYLYNTLPSNASPEINNLCFYADGTLNEFEYVCEFLIRNDGDKPCELQKVEYIFEDAKFENS